MVSVLGVIFYPWQTVLNNSYFLLSNTYSRDIYTHMYVSAYSNICIYKCVSKINTIQKKYCRNEILANAKKNQLHLLI